MSDPQPHAEPPPESRAEQALSAVFRFVERRALALSAVVAVLAIAVALGFGLRYAASGVAETIGQEPIILFGIMKIMAGESLYTSMGGVHFDMTQYTPLYYYLVAWVSSAAGYVAGDAAGVTEIGRFVSLAFAAANLALIVFIMVRFLKCRLSLALAVCAVQLAVRLPWDFLARPDALITTLLLASLAFGLAALRRPPESRACFALLVAAGFAGFLAFLTKQNGAQMPVVIFTLFLMRKEWRRAVAVALGAGVPLLVLLAGHGPLFGAGMLENLSRGMDNGLDPYCAILRTWRPVFLSFNGAVLTALCVPLAMRWLRPRVSPERQLLAYAAVFFFVFAAFSSLHLGSAPHHYGDYVILTLMCLAMYVETNRGEAINGDCQVPTSHYCPSSGNNGWLSPGLSCAVPTFCVLFLPQVMALNLEPVWAPHNRFEGRARVSEYLAEEIEQHPDAYFCTTDNTLANMHPRRVVAPHHHLAAIAVQRNVFAYPRLQELMDEGRIRWCILGFGQNPTRQLGFLNIRAREYKRVMELDLYSVWVLADETGT